MKVICKEFLNKIYTPEIRKYTLIKDLEILTMVVKVVLLGLAL